MQNVCYAPGSLGAHTRRGLGSMEVCNQAEFCAGTWVASNVSVNISVRAQMTIATTI